MTAKQWFANEQNVTGLREVLANEFLQGALSVIADESRPNHKESQAIATVRTAGDAAFALSCVHLQQAGMNRALDRLQELSKLPKPATQMAEQQPFEHITA